MSARLIVESLVKSVIILGFLLTAFAYMTLYERRLVGRVQVRYGPNRVGPGGLLQPLADGVKLALNVLFAGEWVDLAPEAFVPLIGQRLVGCSLVRRGRTLLAGLTALGALHVALLLRRRSRLSGRSGVRRS